MAIREGDRVAVMTYDEEVGYTGTVTRFGQRVTTMADDLGNEICGYDVVLVKPDRDDLEDPMPANANAVRAAAQ